MGSIIKKCKGKYEKITFKKGNNQKREYFDDEELGNGQIIKNNSKTHQCQCINLSIHPQIPQPQSPQLQLIKKNNEYKVINVKASASSTANANVININTSNGALNTEKNVGKIKNLPLVNQTLPLHSKILKKFGPKLTKSSLAPQTQIQENLNLDLKKKLSKMVSIGSPPPLISSKMDLNASRQFSLMEQKRVQWEKEKQELSGLWSPWGRPKNSTTLAEQVPLVNASYINKLGKQMRARSESDCHLPPIKNVTAEILQTQSSAYWYENGIANKSSTTAASNTTATAHESPKKDTYSSSLSLIKAENEIRARSMGNLIEETENEVFKIECDSKGNMIKGSLKKSNQINDKQHQEDSSGYQSSNGCSRQSSGDGPRGNTEKSDLNYSKSGSESLPSPPSPPAGRHSHSPNEMDIFDPKKNGPTIIRSLSPDRSPRSKSKGVKGGGGSKKSPRKSNSMNSISIRSGIQDSICISITGKSQHSQPQPAAMRSSFTVGIETPQNDAYEDIIKSEKEEWLNELEKQRNEERLRKEKEKEERRPKWGDRGIGVGHFWEPANSSNARLPSRDENEAQLKELTAGGTTTGGSKTPAWLLSRLSSSERNLKKIEGKSPNCAFFGIPPENEEFEEDVAAEEDKETEPQLNPESEEKAEKTYFRGQNKLLDPEYLAEKEKKREAALEHQKAIRRQIEERQERLKEEREKRLKKEAEMNKSPEAMKSGKKKKSKEGSKRLSRVEKYEMEEEEKLKGKINGNGKKSDKDENLVLPPINNPNPNNNNNNSGGGDDKSKSVSGRNMKNGQNGSSASMKSRSVSIMSDESMFKSNQTSRMSSVGSRMQDQCLMTEADLTDATTTTVCRMLTPTVLRRSRSYHNENATQTDHEDSNENERSGSTSSLPTDATITMSKKGAGGVDDEGRRDRSRSKKRDESKEKDKENKSKPIWGVNQSKTQYLKNSEKDPMYQLRQRRRFDRMRRREEKRREFENHTGTESDGLQRVQLSRKLMTNSVRLKSSKLRMMRKEAAERKTGPVKAFATMTEIETGESQSESKSKSEKKNKLKNSKVEGAKSSSKNTSVNNNNTEKSQEEEEEEEEIEIEYEEEQEEEEEESVTILSSSESGRSSRGSRYSSISYDNDKSVNNKNKNNKKINKIDSRRGSFYNPNVMYEDELSNDSQNETEVILPSPPVPALYKKLQKESSGNNNEEEEEEEEDANNYEDDFEDDDIGKDENEDRLQITEEHQMNQNDNVENERERERDKEENEYSDSTYSSRTPSPPYPEEEEENENSRDYFNNNNNNEKENQNEEEEEEDYDENENQELAEFSNSINTDFRGGGGLNLNSTFSDLENLRPNFELLNNSGMILDKRFARFRTISSKTTTLLNDRPDSQSPSPLLNEENEIENEENGIENENGCCGLNEYSDYIPPTYGYETQRYYSNYDTPDVNLNLNSSSYLVYQNMQQEQKVKAKSEGGGSGGGMYASYLSGPRPDTRDSEFSMREQIFTYLKDEEIGLSARSGYSEKGIEEFNLHLPKELNYFEPHQEEYYYPNNHDVHEHHHHHHQHQQRSEECEESYEENYQDPYSRKATFSWLYASGESNNGENHATSLQLSIIKKECYQPQPHRESGQRNPVAKCMPMNAMAAYETEET